MRVKRYKVRCNYCHHIQDYRTVCENCESYMYPTMDTLEEVRDEEKPL